MLMAIHGLIMIVIHKINKMKMIEDCIQYCKYLLDDMQLFELHYFN